MAANKLIACSHVENTQSKCSRWNISEAPISIKQIDTFHIIAVFKSDTGLA